MAKDLRPFGDPGSDHFRVKAYPFYLLNRAVSRYNVIIESELRAIGIDIPTWRVLMILGESEPLAVGQVAKSAVINISTMMRIIERMQKRAAQVALRPANARLETQIYPAHRVKIQGKLVGLYRRY